MSFGKSLSRELGKNTGKYISNKIFGTGHSTPHRVMIERVERKKQREEAREYKLKHNELERIRRERERQFKELEKEEAEIQKLEMIAANEEEVRGHNNYLKIIQSLHKSYSDCTDWDELESSIIKFANETPVQQVNEVVENFYRSKTDEQIDREISKLKSSFQLTWQKKIFDKYFGSLNIKFLNKILFKNDNEKLSELHNDIKLLEEKREIWFREYLEEHEDNFKNYQKQKKYYELLAEVVSGIKEYRKIAIKNKNDFKYLKSIDKDELFDDCLNLIFKYQLASPSALKEGLFIGSNRVERILNHMEELKILHPFSNNSSLESIKKALDFFNPFEDLSEYGSDISYQVRSNKIIVEFYVFSKKIIPKTTKRLVRKGLEIREDQIPESRFNEIYQDYVCSCILRIAKEIFQLLLSIQHVQINAKDSFMNSTTGNFEERTIVSVNINRSKLDKLNLDLLDPSDSLNNFEHRMDFNKKEGFKPVLNF